MQRMSVPHPIPYQGSKRKLAPQILKFFPPSMTRLIEPFAGSAAVSIAAMYQHRVNNVLLNDLNVPLIQLWNEILSTPEKIAASYTVLWNMQRGQERDYYDWVRQQFNHTQRPDYFLYLLARCVKAAVRYNTKGEFNQSPDNRRKGTKPDTMRKHIMGAAQLLHGKTITCAKDYREILAEAKPSDLIYFDPPYQGVSGKRDPRYLGGFSYEGFVETLRELNQQRIAYIVSYDGKSGTKSYGKLLPSGLNLKHIELDAGRSSQATLLGRTNRTLESLYLSPTLVEQLEIGPGVQQEQIHLSLLYA